MAPATAAARISEIESVAALLGGRKALGADLTSEADFIALVRQGMPLPAFEAVRSKLQLTLGQIEQTLGISPRSLLRRKKGRRLSKTESELLLRLARVVARAEHVLGARDAALEWLATPNRALRGDKPFNLLDTELGAKRVLDLLGRIEFGVYT